MTRGLKRGLKKNFKDARCDAVLMIDCIASVPEPFFIYVHSSRDSLIALDAPARMIHQMAVCVPNMTAAPRKLK